MTPPPPRFERFSKHLAGMSDPIAITLKGHLLAEEMLDDIILSRCRDPAALKGFVFSFSAKLRLAQALLGDTHESGTPLPTIVWPMLNALNDLRNDLAHRLESEKLEPRLRKFIDSATGALAEHDGPPELFSKLRRAIDYTLGYLCCLEFVVKTGEVPPEL